MVSAFLDEARPGSTQPPLPSPLAWCQAQQPKAAGWRVGAEGDGVWARASVRVCERYEHVGGGETSLVAPIVVRSRLTWCLPSLMCETCPVFPVTQLQNKHVSSTHPETTGNLGHVSEYTHTHPLIDFLLCFIHSQLLVTLSSTEELQTETKESGQRI